MRGSKPRNNRISTRIHLSTNLQIRWAMMVKTELQEDTTDEGASKALHDLLWIDLTEPDPKHNGAAMKKIGASRSLRIEGQAKRADHGSEGRLLQFPL
jgi:hypothetical protein